MPIVPTSRIRDITVKNGELRKIHKAMLGKSCTVLDCVVGDCAVFLMGDDFQGDYRHTICTSPVVSAWHQDDREEFVIETCNTVYTLERFNREE